MFLSKTIFRLHEHLSELLYSELAQYFIHRLFTNCFQLSLSNTAPNRTQWKPYPCLSNFCRYVVWIVNTRKTFLFLCYLWQNKQLRYVIIKCLKKIHFSAKKVLKIIKKILPKIIHKSDHTFLFVLVVIIYYLSSTIVS